MGRPTKTQARKKALNPKEGPADPFSEKTDAQVLRIIHDRFDVADEMTDGSINGTVRSFIMSGAPGIGKTFNVEQAMKRAEVAAADKGKRFRYKFIKGAVTPINLYKELYNYRQPGDVIVLDDADSVFFDDNGVSILKAALDSTPNRYISWLSESHALKSGSAEEDVPTTFLYDGTMIFITNTDFQAIVDEGRSKLAPHFSALLSRSMYLDLAIHNRRAIAIWVHYLVNNKNILVNHYDLTKDEQKKAVDWILRHRDEMRTLSIRDAMKIGQLMKTNPETWERNAQVLFLKENM